MKPISFEQANVIYKASGCLDLPTYKDENEIISCWTPNEEELEYIKACIAKGEKPKIYLSIMGNNQPPVYVGCEMFKEEENNV